jgi:hypothetical protein
MERVRGNVTNQLLNDVWCSTDGELFAVGMCRTVLYKNNAELTLMDCPDGDVLGYHLNGVWGTGGDDVYTVGSDGTILHYDGVVWSLVTNSIATVDLADVCGTSPEDVWAVGEYGTALHFDGTAWETSTTTVTSHLKAVWANSPNDVFAVGSGLILHFNGTSWREMAAPEGDHARQYQDVWGSSGTDVYAVEGNEEISHYDGSGWSAFTIDGLVDASYITGAGENDVYITAQYFDVFHYDGSSWEDIRQGTFWRERWRGGYATASDGFVGVSFDLIKNDGTEWVYLTERKPALECVWVSPEGEIFGGNQLGSVVVYDGTNWTEHEYVMQNPVSKLWGTARNDLYALEYTNAISHFDGSTWSAVQSWPDDGYVMDMWGSRNDDIFVVGEVYGEPGHVLHFDGSDWSPMTVPEMQWPSFKGVWGFSSESVYAVGTAGVVLHYDGVEWSVTDTLSTDDLIDVWGRSEDDLYALGTDKLFHFDAADWNVEVTGYAGILKKICGVGTNDVVAVGEMGTMLRFDGTSWSELPRITTSALNDVVGYGQNGAIVVGDGDLVIRLVIE